MRGKSASAQAPSIVPKFPTGSGTPAPRTANGSGCPPQTTVALASLPSSSSSTAHSVQSAGPGRSKSWRLRYGIASSGSGCSCAAVRSTWRL